MGFWFRQSIRLWKGASLNWSTPIRGRGAQGTSSVLGILVGGIILLVGFFALLQAITPHSSPATSNVVRSDGTRSLHPPTPPAPPPQALTAVESQAAIQPTAPVSSASLAGAKRSFLQYAGGQHDGQPVQGKTLFETMELQKRGFTLSGYAGESPAFWTFRKTDAQREYTAIAMADLDGRITAVTAELITPEPNSDGLAKSYFGAFISTLAAPSVRGEALKWLDQQIGSVMWEDFGDLHLSLAGTSKIHHRITIQPK